MSTITITLDDELLLQVKEYARQHQITVEEVIIRALREFLAAESASEEKQA